MSSPLGSSNDLFLAEQRTSHAMDQAQHQQLLLQALARKQNSAAPTAQANRPATMQQYLQQQGQQQQLAQLFYAADIAHHQRQRALLLASVASGDRAAAPGNAFAPNRDVLMQRLQQLQSPATLSSLDGLPSRASAVSPLSMSHSSDIYAQQGVFGSRVNSNMSAAMGSHQETDLITGEVLVDSKIRKGRKKPKDHPRRPLSAYNIFFKEERQRILNGIPDASAADKAAQEGSAPARKRKKNPHGKIGFESLAKAIGQKWQELNRDEVQYYKAQADVDKKRYRDEMDVYNMAKLRAADSGSDIEKSLDAGLESGDSDEENDSAVHASKKAKTEL